MSLTPWFRGPFASVSPSRGITLALILLISSQVLGAQQSADLGDFDAFVTTTMKAFKVPGTAIAVVKDGKIILAKGYGFRDMERRLPVTTKTVFPNCVHVKIFHSDNPGHACRPGQG